MVVTSEKLLKSVLRCRKTMLIVDVSDWRGERLKRWMGGGRKRGEVNLSLFHHLTSYASNLQVKLSSDVGESWRNERASIGRNFEVDSSSRRTSVAQCDYSNGGCGGMGDSCLRPPLPCFHPRRSSTLISPLYEKIKHGLPDVQREITS